MTGSEVKIVCMVGIVALFAVVASILILALLVLSLPFLLPYAIVKAIKQVMGNPTVRFAIEKERIIREVEAGR